MSKHVERLEYPIRYGIKASPEDIEKHGYLKVVSNLVNDLLAVQRMDGIELQKIKLLQNGQGCLICEASAKEVHSDWN